MRTLFILVSILTVISAVSARHGNLGGGSRVGGYSPIKNLKDPEVQEIAKYAVSEHNKKDHANLEYVKVVRGESQVVAGTNYRLVISAKDGGGAVKEYEAVVYDRPWDHRKELTSFTPAA